MDIILPYTHSQFGELLYAVRSICKYQPHDNLIIVGDCPHWYNGIHVACDDIQHHPERSVVKKILAAIPKATEDFILWQDDIFQVKEQPILAWHCGTLKRAVEKRHEGRFKNIMSNTYNLFPDGYYYGGHRPMVINGVKFIEAVSKHWKDKDYIPKTFYGNFADIGGEFAVDCKIPGQPDYRTLERWIADKPFFSTSHYGFSDDVKRWCQQHYSEKCKYEKA